MHRIFLTLLIQVIITQSFGQSESQFHSPLMIPMYLSGNFGEIRSNHFHSGIDIKTQGTTGHHVFAIESGYISRIKVQANGYGKSIYISHPDGYTSVYGHLNKYREDVEAYVKDIQYNRQSHQVDIYPESDKFPLNRGEFIAYSGNTGGSLGPHLHFEIRNSANQHPTNVLKYGFDISDHSAPKFQKLFVYPLEEGAMVNGSSETQSFSLVPDKGVYTIPWGTQIELSGKIGIGVEVYDFLDGAANRCGIYSLAGYLDEQLFYQHEMEEFSFSETRYVNARIDYQEFTLSKRKPHRLYRLPNDKLRIYRHLEKDGILDMAKPGSHTIRVQTTDVAGNSSVLTFKLDVVSGKPGSPEKSELATTFMKYDEPSVYENSQVKVEIPAGALYENLEFTYSETPPSKGFLSVNYLIHTPGTPLHLPYTLSVKAPDVAPGLRDKLIFVSYDSEEGKTESAGGKYVEGRLVARLRSFGEYAISMDTLAPIIIPINGSALKDQRGHGSLRFTIRDDLSGIEKYEGFIDNRWALFEYDPKNDLLIHVFDEEKSSRNSEHELELYITDSQGNVNLYHSIFNW